MQNEKYIGRTLDKPIRDSMTPGRVTVIYGPRRVGKTTLLKKLVSEETGNTLLTTGEDSVTRAFLMSRNVEQIKKAFSRYALIVIDEAQTIPEIGACLKMLVDWVPEARVVVSGSSSFELANQIGEPLTGRKLTFTMYPISAQEIARQDGVLTLMQQRDDLLIYGSYPEILMTSSNDEKRQRLMELCSDYLYKDILMWDNLRNAAKLRHLLAMLALQVGSECSLRELSGTLGFAIPTITRYLDLLEKSFVIRRLGGFSQNMRNEVTRHPKYYFYDNGILNALLQNFNPVSIRPDVGVLWENWLVMERLKKLAYSKSAATPYFWRTYTRSEVDWVEAENGSLHGYEFKWGDKARPRSLRAWRQAYPQAACTLINRDSFLGFVTEDGGIPPVKL